MFSKGKEKQISPFPLRTSNNKLPNIFNYSKFINIMKQRVINSKYPTKTLPWGTRLFLCINGEILD